MNEIEQAKTLVRHQRYYESINELMYWDRQFQLPKEGWVYMDEIQEFQMQQAHQELLSEQTKVLLKQFEERPEICTNDYARGCVRKLQEMYTKASNLPSQLLSEKEQLCAKEQVVWKEAYEKNDFQIFFPWMKKQFELQRRLADTYDPNKKPYDVLLQQWDRSLDTEMVTATVQELKEPLSAICELATERYKTVDTSSMELKISRSVSETIVKEAMTLIGFQKDRGTLGEVLHPVCTCMGPRDSRPTTNYRNLWEAVLSVSHECGHGIYNYSSNEEAVSYGLWGGIDGMFHESQGRFYENMVCKTKEFWSTLYPKVQELVPEFRKISLEEFYPMFVKPKYSPTRITADEMTYDLHIIVRFEMERDYFEGKIKLEDFREIWNEKYKRYLHIMPQSDREGILQDVHWASGHVAYFQSYLLGDLYAAQFRNKMLEEKPEVFIELKRGNIGVLNDWMSERVYQYGQTYTPDKLLKKVTGEKLNAQYYLDYLKEKYQV